MLWTCTAGPASGWPWLPPTARTSSRCSTRRSDWWPHAPSSSSSRSNGGCTTATTNDPLAEQVGAQPVHLVGGHAKGGKVIRQRTVVVVDGAPCRVQVVLLHAEHLVGQPGFGEGDDLVGRPLGGRPVADRFEDPLPQRGHGLVAA